MLDLIHLLRSRISWRDVLVLMISLGSLKESCEWFGVCVSCSVTKLKLKKH